MTMMKNLTFVFILALGLAACSDAVETDATFDFDVNDPAIACVTDEDCTLVNESCCGCGGGGNQVAINGEYEDAYADYLDCPEDVVCVASISNDPSCSADAVAICEDSLCQVSAE